ncbi:BRCA2-interacting transcriptional repressor EMSY [Linepithema humile]|uniref:BRCA2-interacting transcriptional repressor EMSY n=1 Tax=Linepithema humile TaxID=83485 RepID=UPI0006233270|nr:PREDICTED: protein EMSY [Linepithema humile]
MWPMRPEMTRDECKKCLRRLESDAYGSMVSVLRAQGPFTNDKQKLLQELAKVLHISNERHRSEVRRVVNDDMLATIAEQLNGPNTGTDWAIESRRTIPLMPRLKARSAFTTLANSLSLATTIADEKKPNRHVIPRWHANSTAAESESQSEVQTEENLSVHTKLCSLENDLDISKILEENSNLAKDEKIDDKDKVSRVSETPKISRLPEKRKQLSPLPAAPPNKVLVVSKTTPLDHNFWTVENEQASSQVPSAITHHQNVAVISSTTDEISTNSNSKESITASEYLSGHTAVSSDKPVAITTISVCTSNTSEPTTVPSIIKNKVSTKIVPAVSSSTLNTPLKEQSENKDAHSQDVANNTQKSARSENTNSNPSCNKRSMASIIHEAIMSSTPHRHTVAVYPGTTVSSGPGPPQIKQPSETLMCKKLPSEQIKIFNQSTAKTGATINSKKVVNIPHYPNAKLNTKTNVIVIQKGHTKGVTLSHAGKEILGKVIIGGKNLCVTSQHNTNSISVQPHHISLNNGDQTKTALPTANSPQNAESVKTNSGKTAVVSVVTALRHDLTDKNKALSQLFDPPDGLNSESKTVIPNNARLLKEECNNDANTVDRKSALKTDPVDTLALEEKQHRNNKDINESMKSQVANLLDSSNSLESREILARQKQLTNTMQDDAGSNIRVEDSDENMDAFGATLDTTDINLENFQYLVDNDDSRILEESARSMMTINQVTEHDDS